VELGQDEAGRILRALAGRGRYLERRAAGSTRTLRMRVRRAQRILRAVGAQLERATLSQLVDALQAVRELVEDTARPSTPLGRRLAAPFQGGGGGVSAEGSPGALQGAALLLQSATDNATLSVGASLVGDFEDPFGEEEQAPVALGARNHIDLEGLEPIEEQWALDLNRHGGGPAGRGSEAESQMSDSQYSGRMVRRTGSHTQGSDFTADSVRVATQRARQIRRRITRQVAPNLRGGRGQPWEEELKPARWGLLFFSDRRRMHANMAIILGASLLVVFGACAAVVVATSRVFGQGMKTEVERSLRDFNEQHLRDLVTASAGAVEDHLLSIREGVAENVAEQARVLLEDGVVPPLSGAGAPETVLRPLPSYPHFTMDPLHCSSGGDSREECPVDLGPLEPRLPAATGDFFRGQNGSLRHPSAYTFGTHSGFHHTVSKQERYNAHLRESPALGVTLSALAAMDGDFSSILEAHADSTLQIYAAVELPHEKGGGHHAVRLTYPGYNLQGFEKSTGLHRSDSYDPSQRHWFREAQEVALALQGPYIETATGNKVVALSVKRAFASAANGGREVTVVGAAVLHMRGLGALMRRVLVPSPGAAYAVLAKSDGEVVAFSGGTMQHKSFDPETGGNLKLWEIEDDLLSARERIFSGVAGSVRVTRGTEAEGFSEWLVVYQPILQDGAASGPLVYITEVELLDTWAREPDTPTLMAESDSNVERIKIDVVLLSAIATIIVFLTMMLCSRPLMPPLKYLQCYSTAIFEATATEWGRENDERYSQVVKAISAMRDSQDVAVKNEEFRPLVLGFNKMVKRLAMVENVKKSTPRFPKNPLHEMNELLLAGRTQECLDLIQKADPPDQRSITTLSERLSVVLVPSLLSSLETGLDEEAQEVEEPARDRGGCLENLVRRTSWKVLGALAFMLSLSFIVTIGAFALREQSRFGSFWQKEATDFFEKAVLVRAQHLNSMQASISTAVIKMLSLDTVMSSKFAGRLLAGELTRAVADQSRFQLESFSMDCGITSEGCWGGSAFAKDCGNVSSASPLISGYFSKYEPRYECAAEGEGHEVDSAERHIIDHATTKLTAFLDLKFRSLVRRGGGNSTQVQIGLEDSETALARSFPYVKEPYGGPAECYYDADARLLPQKYAFCKLAQQGCHFNSFAPYDPRCRAWYQAAAQSKNTEEVSLLGSNIQSTGEMRLSPGAVSAVSAITTNGSREGELVGVVHVKYVAAEDRISRKLAKVSGGAGQSGLHNLPSAAFVVVTERPKSVLLHSLALEGAPAECFGEGGGLLDDLDCFNPAFTLQEWMKMEEMLPRISHLSSQGQSFTFSFTWMNGENMVMSSTPLRSSRGKFVSTLITVQALEGLDQVDTVRDTREFIQKTVKSHRTLLIVGMALILACLAVLMTLAVDIASRSVKTMHAVCESIVSGELLKYASNSQQKKLLMSYEIRKVLEAFSSTLVILRCGLDFFFSGSMEDAIRNFDEAEQLFSSVSNDKGLGIARNNLAIAHMALSDTDKAGEKFMLSIGNAQDSLQQASEGLRQATYKMGGAEELRGAAIRELRQAMRVLSDRMGNYASFLLTDDGMVDGEDPEYVIEKGLHIDKALGNRYGWVIKQSLLGRLALRQGRLDEARQIFDATLEEVAAGRGGMNMPSSLWDPEELAAAQQLSMYNAYLMAHATGRPRDEMRRLLVDCISVPRCHDPLMGTLSTAFDQLVELSQTKEERAGLKVVARCCRLNVYSKRPKKGAKSVPPAPSMRRRRGSRDYTAPGSAIAILEPF